MYTKTQDEMHSPGGYCMTTRKAQVSGRIEKSQFVALSYELYQLDKISA
jgi:hypothetical protein